MISEILPFDIYVYEKRETNEKTRKRENERRKQRKPTREKRPSDHDPDSDPRDPTNRRGLTPVQWQTQSNHHCKARQPLG